MGIGWPQILIVVVLLVLLFGRGKISDLMGDVAKGIKSFKKGIREEPPTTAPQVTDATDAAGPAVEPAAARQEAGGPGKI